MTYASSTSGALDISIHEGGNGGDIYFSHPDLPGNLFDFKTCEGVLSENKDFGLFSVSLPTKDWRVGPGALGYTWTYPAGIRVDFDAAVSGDALDMTYTVTNTTSTLVPRVQIHPCLPTSAAPAFRPPADPGSTKESSSFMALYRHLQLWSRGQMFSFASAKTAATEMHLAFMKQGEIPVDWAWWRNDAATFDLPLIALSSLDGSFVLAYGFESAIWSSSNISDVRACFHMFPYFGDLQPGASSRVKGKLYFFKGTPVEARERFLKDFPKFNSLEPG
jgi:hypothetical protein